jgi:hypothetical protein
MMNENIEKHVIRIVLDEYDGEERIQSSRDSEFESIIDILECKRTEKDYEWMSDVFIPEFPSIHLTEASQWANQYFQSRDFVEVYLDGDSPEVVKKSRAAKKYINNMLNVREIYHYQKYMRARSINSMRGYVIAVCGWRQELKNNPVTTERREYSGVDDYGNPQYDTIAETNNDTEPIVDHFYYEVPDPRNVRFDNTYCYSIQDKSWITIRSEMSYDQLKTMEKSNDYFNLDKVKKMIPTGETDASKKTSDDDVSPNDSKTVKLFDVLERFGKVWAVVTDMDEEGYPTKIKPGYDEAGEQLESAALIEAITTVVSSGGTKVLIRFQPTPFRTSTNRPYRPIIRGLCYIHPTKDVGMSDGLYGKEMQILINDMMNLGIDRTKLATFPTLQMKRHAFDDNDSVYFEPEHPILVDEIGDVQEFKIVDDISGALDIVGFSINKLQQVQSVYPTTMGELPGKASTTATAIAGAESRGNLRANYKSLTFEYTFLQDLYWMMLQMGYQFMHPKTIMKILGQEMQSFDPDQDYTYQPVTSNIETEYNKDKKLQRYDQMLGRIANIPNPAIVPIIATIIARELELLGDEFQTIAPMVKMLAQTPNTPEQGTGAQTPKDAAPMPTSNQSGNPMSMPEQSVRGI